ncbi:hypothetical protein AOLI_G00298150 [Acnodon oligacanthus]
MSPNLIHMKILSQSNAREQMFGSDKRDISYKGNSTNFSEFLFNYLIKMWSRSGWSGVKRSVLGERTESELFTVVVIGARGPPPKAPSRKVTT